MFAWTLNLALQYYYNALQFLRETKTLPRANKSYFKNN